jgi:GntR family transcriptional regulator/MocR family aminotransferase
MPHESAPNLLIRLDPASSVALQRQIYDGIRRAILQGIARPGMRLPSSRALATDLGISRTTTLLALEQLQAEGYLVSRAGSGSFVAHDLPDDLTRTPPEPLGFTPKAAHPPFSARGSLIAGTHPPSIRILGAPRAFRLGTPAVDLFPRKLWASLAVRRLRSLRPADLDYGDYSGFMPLRQAIADQVRTSRGTQCEAAQIFITAGSQRGFELLCSVLLDPGDLVWLEDPVYPGAVTALRHANAKIQPVPVDSEGLSLEAAVATGGDARLVFVTPSHQFPLGVHMSLPRRLALLRWASAHSAWIVEDDYDSEFRYRTHPIPCLHGLDTEGRVIYIGSFSKSVFPALRLGFLIVPADLVDKLAAARRVADIHPPKFEQTVLADFINEGHYDRHLRRMRAVYRERLDAMADALKRHCSGVLSLRSVHTGLHAIADVVGIDAEDLTSEALASGVEVIPLSAYSLGGARPPNALALGFASVPPAELAAGVERLAGAIDRVQSRRRKIL